MQLRIHLVVLLACAGACACGGTAPPVATVATARTSSEARALSPAASQHEVFSGVVAPRATHPAEETISPAADASAKVPPPPPGVSADPSTAHARAVEEARRFRGLPREAVPDGAPKVRMGSVQVTDHVVVEIVQRIVRQGWKEVQKCYEVGLRDRPSLQGVLTFRFTIDALGLPASVTSTAEARYFDAVRGLPEGTDPGPDDGEPSRASVLETISECVKTMLEKRSFPADMQGSVVLPIVLKFEPAHAPVW